MINIPKICGTCNGATKSLELVYDVYEKEMNKEYPKNIYIYKDILHNDLVKEELNSMGIEVIYSLDKLTSDDIVILRAHGEGEETYKYLEKKGIEYYDATCPNVLKIHKLVKEKCLDGYEIVIIGNKEHPEVIGTNGWVNNKGIIVSNKEDIKNIKKSNKIFIIVQTTFNKELYNELVDLIKDNYSSSIIEIHNSLCNAVSRIINSSIDLASSSDIMFVIGGSNSSNTKELYNSLAKITKTYMFSSIKDFYLFVMNNDISIDNNIGITGGASTPIKEIYNYKYLLSFLLFYKDRIKNINSTPNELINNILSKYKNDNIKKYIEYFKDLYEDTSINSILISLINNDKYTELVKAYNVLLTSINIYEDLINNNKYHGNNMTIPKRICNDYINNYNNINYKNDTLKLANSTTISISNLIKDEAINYINNFYKSNSINNVINTITTKVYEGNLLDEVISYNNKYYNYIDDLNNLYELKYGWKNILGPIHLSYTLEGLDLKDDSLYKKINMYIELTKELKNSNIRNYKETFIYNYIINTNYKEEFLSMYGKDITNENDYNRLITIIKNSNVYNEIEDYRDNLLYDIYNDLDNEKLEDNIKDIIKGLLIYHNIIFFYAFF